MTTIQIKRLEHNDTEFIEQMLQHHIDKEERLPPTSEHLQGMLKDNRTYLFAALHRNEIAGYALAYSFPSLYASARLAYMYDIDVTPEYRQKGIGSRLMHAVKTCLEQDGVYELWLGTSIDNMPAQALFSGTGGYKSGEQFYDYTFEL